MSEANAIGTLWLRAGLLDEPSRSELRGVLRDYTDARVDLGRIGTDLGNLRDARERSAEAERAAWALVEHAVRSGINPGVVTTLVSGANEVIDLDELRMASLENFVPAPIILLLVVVASVALGVWVNPWWLAFTGFVGLNLLQSAFTGWCPMMAILRRFGLRA